MATRQTPSTSAKDSDRSDTCQVLDSAFSEGQLSMEEHRQRVASATNAATLGALADLVSDLQNTNAPVQMPNLKSRPRSPSKLWAQPAGGGWGLRLATAAVLVLLGIGIGWGLYGNTGSPLSFQTDPGAKADGIPAKVLTPPRQLQSLGGLNGLFEQMRQKFGDTTGFELNIRPDRATLYRPDSEDPRRKLMYDYRGGWGDPYSTTTVDSDDRVDMSKFNVEQTIAVLRGAPETLKSNARTSPTPGSTLNPRRIRPRPTRSTSASTSAASSAAASSTSRRMARSSKSASPASKPLNRHLSPRCSVVYIGAIQLCEVSRRSSDRQRGWFDARARSAGSSARVTHAWLRAA